MAARDSENQLTMRKKVSRSENKTRATPPLGVFMMLNHILNSKPLGFISTFITRYSRKPLCWYLAEGVLYTSRHQETYAAVQTRLHSISCGYIVSCAPFSTLAIRPSPLPTFPPMHRHLTIPHSTPLQSTPLSTPPHPTPLHPTPPRPTPLRSTHSSPAHPTPLRHITDRPNYPISPNANRLLNARLVL